MRGLNYFQTQDALFRIAVQGPGVFYLPGLGKRGPLVDIWAVSKLFVQTGHGTGRQQGLQKLLSQGLPPRLVLQGQPFREAYRIVGEQIAAGTFEPPSAIEHTHEGSIGQLCLPDIERKWAGVYQGFEFEVAVAAIDRLVADG